jgi:hypothetical protein
MNRIEGQVDADRTAFCKTKHHSPCDCCLQYYLGPFLSVIQLYIETEKTLYFVNLIF